MSLPQVDLDIANLALGHLGVSKEIANLSTEKSKEAVACRKYFDLAREAVLRDFPWPFATKIATLSLVEEDPNSEWAYSYRYPTDCVYFRRILSGIRNDPRESRVPYRIARDSSGKLIFTDLDSAVGEYTVRLTTVTQYPPDFSLCLSYRLAAYIANSVTGAEPFKLKDEMMKHYKLELELAAANAANEEQPEEEPLTESFAARE